MSVFPFFDLSSIYVSTAGCANKPRRKPHINESFRLSSVSLRTPAYLRTFACTALSRGFCCCLCFCLGKLLFYTLIHCLICNRRGKSPEPTRSQ